MGFSVEEIVRINTKQQPTVCPCVGYSGAAKVTCSDCKGGGGLKGCKTCSGAGMAPSADGVVQLCQACGGRGVVPYSVSSEALRKISAARRAKLHSQQPDNQHGAAPRTAGRMKGALRGSGRG